MIQTQHGRGCRRLAPKVAFKSSSKRHASCCKALKSGKTCAKRRKRRAPLAWASLSKCEKSDSLWVMNKSTAFLQCCTASRGNKCKVRESNISLRSRPSSEAQSCATERGSTVGSSLPSPRAMAPSRIRARGLCASVPQSNSSWMWDAHMSNAACVSWMGSTVRGGPGTSSLLLMDGSKQPIPSGGSGCALLSSLSTRPRQAVSLRCASSIDLQAVPPLGLPDASSPASAARPAAYSPMNSSRHATGSAKGEASLFRALISLSRRRRTSAGSAEKTHASKSTPNMFGMKSS
mmetsp:Transcript_159531/g.488161  ORF Transcript_159531/g.488161 Transcript_159531/m.488161 type:complete len:291 (+) Transcript_159531:855-1727(+)